ncbi:MAG: hypothetical protein JWP27_463 [Flaviaesturariibacter sp.]|nr:hypothetical protein [Flaviaesturariibacter sp.]
MTDIERPRHRHRRRHRTKKQRARLRPVDIFLLVWSIVSLVLFFYLLDKVDSAPPWQIAALAVSTAVGLLLFFRLGLRAKK